MMKMMRKTLQILILTLSLRPSTSIYSSLSLVLLKSFCELRFLAFILMNCILLYNEHRLSKTLLVGAPVVLYSICCTPNYFACFETRSRKPWANSKMLWTKTESQVSDILWFSDSIKARNPTGDQFRMSIDHYQLVTANFLFCDKFGLSSRATAYQKSILPRKKYKKKIIIPKVKKNPCNWKRCFSRLLWYGRLHWVTVRSG